MEGQPTARMGWKGRTFVVMTFVIVVAIVVVSIVTDDVRVALREIERVGGSTDKTHFSGDFEGPVRQVNLQGKQIGDAQIEQVAPLLVHFPELFTLDLSMSQVSDLGLELLRGYNQLSDLLLRYTQVSDDGMKHLQGWSKLYTLDLMCTRITDRGLEQAIKNHPNLRALDLDGTRITDQGLEELGLLKKLEWLAVADTAVTDAGLVFIGKAPNLQMLSLRG